jgi:antitoxin (DNA-binding transcriptional repressor) of toxin-antitoxin stability system
MELSNIDAGKLFLDLLDRVERGEEIMITRHGKRVAKLVPVRIGFDREAARAAVARIEARREANLPDPPITIDEILSFIAEGRR